MSVRGGPNTLGPAPHLKQTDPIASQGVGDAGARGRRDGVFVRDVLVELSAVHQAERTKVLNAVAGLEDDGLNQ